VGSYLKFVVERSRKKTYETAWMGKKGPDKTMDDKKSA